jgi:hypothetical protein
MISRTIYGPGNIGDLGRAALERKGISFSGEIKNEPVANTSGGANAGRASAV